jgi:hypothetical protein
MGNTPSNCGINGGVLVNDDGKETCYTSTTTVNVTNFQSATQSQNTTVQAYSGPDRSGSIVPLSVGSSSSAQIQSLVITVNLSIGAIIGIVIGVVILLGLLGYAGHRTYKHYTRFDDPVDYNGRYDPIADGIEEEDESNYRIGPNGANVYTRAGEDYNNRNLGGGYHKIRY